MNIILSIVCGILLVVILFMIKMLRDSSTKSLDISRQFNELRGQYQKIEYSLSMTEKKLLDANIQVKNLQDEIKIMVARDPLSNASNVKKRTKIN